MAPSSTTKTAWGPLTMVARRWALEKILEIQSVVNLGAAIGDRPPIDILNKEEESRILELIAQTHGLAGGQAKNQRATNFMKLCTGMAVPNLFCH
jgi:hypothetical protein